MSVCYDKLWKILIDKNMKRTELKEASGISFNVLARMGKNEAIAQKSQNIKWETTVDKQKVGHKLIRRVSLDQFYALVTGQEDAFYQMCMALPRIIQEAVYTMENVEIPHDTVIEELKNLSDEYKKKGTNIAYLADMLMKDGEKYETDDSFSLAMSVFLLGFGGYKGFD